VVLKKFKSTKKGYAKNEEIPNNSGNDNTKAFGLVRV
jgi:hypothetical protein